MKLAVQIVPADDLELVSAVRDLVRALSDVEPVEAPIEGPGAPRRDVEWLALGGLVLAAPQTAVALIDLAARLSRGRGRGETRQRIEPPLTRAQALVRGRPVTLTVGEVTLDLGRVSIDQVLDALAAAGIRGGHDRSD